MSAEQPSARAAPAWSDSALELRVGLDALGSPRLSYLRDPSCGASAAEGGDASGLPLVDLVVGGSGQQFSGRRYSESVAGHQMLYAGHTEQGSGPWHELQIALEPSTSGLRATVVYEILVGAGVLRSRVRLTNSGDAPVAVESVTSFLGGGLPGPGGSLEDVEVWWAENEWLSEGRWHGRAFRDALPDLNRPLHDRRSRGRFGFTSEGTWSSGIYLPMGAVVNRATGYTLAWQIEHNGAWHWQVGEQTGEGPGASYLALLGPTDIEHQWRLCLAPGEEFESVPVAVAVSGQGFEAAIARLTAYRRAARRPHEDHRRLPVIFNDYMNTIMGEPTTQRLLPLISAAARAGAEFFCIDAGWYAELGENWWETVGEWAPSKTRFPGGLSEVLDHIRAEGMVPGLWLEPEVVGVRSPLAEKLPMEAFFNRDGQRVVENGRYQLDFSHPATRAHLDQVVASLVEGLGVGYLKLDYNIDVAPGTSSGGLTPGVGMLAHNRGYLRWLDGVLDRYGDLTIESCASGAQRTDYALLSRLQLQSTSDQQDLVRYPPIAAAAPVAITPEQSAVWAYPQPEWDDDRIAFTLCNAMLGRVHLSGFLDKMTPSQAALVAQGISAYKEVRPHLAQGTPFWPLGLPTWTAPWVALGIRSPAATHLVVWARGDGAGVGSDSSDGSDSSGGSGGSGGGPAEISVPLSPPGASAEPELVFPTGQASLEWREGTGELRVVMARTPGACLVRFVPPLPGLVTFSPRVGGVCGDDA